MLIRPANQKDCAQLVHLLAELGYELTEQDFSHQAKAYIDSDSCALLVSETDGGDISGFIAGHIFPLIHQAGYIGRIMALVVRTGCQGTGTGSALLERLEIWFKDNECLRFEVNSGDHRNDAHQFYQSKGYRVDERRFIKSCTD